MFNKKISQWALMSLLAGTLVGCGSDSDEASSDDVAYIQYYNASPNSTSTVLALDDYGYSAVDFADSMPRYSYSTGTAELDIYGQDENGDTVVILNNSVSLDNDSRHLFILYDDYHQPSLLDVIFSRTEMDSLNDDEDNSYSKMLLTVANVASVQQEFDAYISLDTQTIDEATMLGNVAYGSYTEQQILDTDEYIVYLTNAGTTEVVYTTGTVSLEVETAYKLVIRDSFGAGELKVTIDVVDSTTTPVNYAALEAAADVRVFNGLETTNINLDISSHQEAQYLYDIVPYGVTEYHSLSFNDYAVTIKDSSSLAILFDNLLASFNQDEVKTILVYQDEDTQVKGMVIEEDLRPRAFEYQFSLVNLSSDFDGLAVYFVRDSETIDSVEYKLSDLDFEEQLQLTLPQDDYEINIVYTADNGTQTLIYQSDVISLQGESNFSYILTPDSSSQFGHRLTAL
ncbi:hypothetical protein [Shewanella gaetbuli]